MMQPEIMLFDEPTSALDPARTSDTLSLIKKLAEQGMTIVMASHDMDFVLAATDTTIFLSGGKIIESGKTTTLFRAPQTSLFKKFIHTVGQ